MSLRRGELRGLGRALLSSAGLTRLALRNRSEWSLPAPPLRDIATLGTVSMDGDTESVGFASSGVPYGVGNCLSIMGTLVHRAGKIAIDVAVQIADPHPNAGECGGSAHGGHRLGLWLLCFSFTVSG